MESHAVKYDGMNDLTYMLHKASQVIEPSTFKIVLATLMSWGIFMFGELYADALLALVMLMTIDTILGVAASYKEGTPIRSRRFSRVVSKGIVYFMAISAGYFADLTLPFDMAIIQGTMIAFVGVTEFISILENVGRLGYDTPKRLLNDLREYRDSK